MKKWATGDPFTAGYREKENIVMKEEDKFTALVVARTNRMRDSLTTLLRAIPKIGAVEQLGNAAAGLTTLPPQPQTLVLLDASLMNQEAWAFMKQAKSHQPWAYCKWLVLANNSFQERIALTAGADRVLLTGFAAAEFFAAIDELVGQPQAYRTQTREVL
jgi:DNA-binding NarL/FixJ family response regulator